MPKISVNLVGELPNGVEPAIITSVAAAVNETTALPETSGQVNLKLVSDAEIAKLNQQYAGRNEPTDVLSFPYGGGDPSPSLRARELGDVAISLEAAIRQAEQAGTALADEIGTLLVHGILHILGFDHQTKAEQLKLDRLQAGIIETAGLKYRKIDWK